jgi:ribosomal protein S18 acetylase RimI-like enzyme
MNETLEYGLLQHIKLCLQCNNESQAIRLLEKYGFEKQAERIYTEQEVLHILDTLWDRLDRWYNEDADSEFNLRKWFDECELKKK